MSEPRQFQIPQIQIMVPQAPTPEMAELEHTQTLLMDEIRGQIVRFAAVNCACRHAPRWSFGQAPPDPPQLGCMVHGAIYLDHDGRLV